MRQTTCFAVLAPVGALAGFALWHDPVLLGAVGILVVALAVLLAQDSRGTAGALVLGLLAAAGLLARMPFPDIVQGQGEAMGGAMSQVGAPGAVARLFEGLVAVPFYDWSWQDRPSAGPGLRAAGGLLRIASYGACVVAALLLLRDRRSTDPGARAVVIVIGVAAVVTPALLGLAGEASPRRLFPTYPLWALAWAVLAHRAWHHDGDRRRWARAAIVAAALGLMAPGVRLALSGEVPAEFRPLEYGLFPGLPPADRTVGIEVVTEAHLPLLNELATRHGEHDRQHVEAAMRGVVDALGPMRSLLDRPALTCPGAARAPELAGTPLERSLRWTWYGATLAVHCPEPERAALCGEAEEPALREACLSGSSGEYRDGAWGATP